MRGLILSVLMGWMLTAHAADDVRSRLSAVPVLRGEFEQEKQLQGFRNPLRSRGFFLLARDHGVVWDTREPFASVTVLTRQRLLTRLPDGSERVVLDAGASPSAAAVNSLLLAVVAGDLEALSEQFDVQERLLANGRWTLRLDPRGQGLSKVIRRVEIDGDRYVRDVLIEEHGGDRSRIRFSALSVVPAELSPEEARRFE